jgi:hypothetical protein
MEVLSMKPSRLHLIHGACTAAAVALLAGCSGSSGLAPSGSSVLAPPGSSSASLARAQSQARGSARSGGALPGVVPHIAQVEPSHVLTAEAAKGPKDLAVTDYAGNTYIFNHAYHLATTIGGFGGADGDRYDSQGNLYVADYVNGVVNEYNASDSLVTQYSSGTSNPINVTTDAAGNVYVADYGGGTVVEFPQGVNTPSQSCSTGLGNEGVAVDAKHNVFVSGNESASGPGTLVEYKGGLAGCNETLLNGVTLGFAGGLQIDKHHNLVACDQGVGVDIIPPPYTSVKSTITGAADSFHVALNKKNTLIYIADLGNSDVLVDKYPSGTNETTIGAANGLDGAAGVATFPD